MIFLRKIRNSTISGAEVTTTAAIILFAIVLTITCINLLVSRKHVHYV